jgi:hypothetical protein
MFARKDNIFMRQFFPILFLNEKYTLNNNFYTL